jgi:hypothetical protein
MEHDNGCDADVEAVATEDMYSESYDCWWGQKGYSLLYITRWNSPQVAIDFYRQRVHDSIRHEITEDSWEHGLEFKNVYGDGEIVRCYDMIPYCIEYSEEMTDSITSLDASGIEAVRKALMESGDLPHSPHAPSITPFTPTPEPEANY